MLPLVFSIRPIDLIGLLENTFGNDTSLFRGLISFVKVELISFEIDSSLFFSLMNANPWFLFIVFYRVRLRVNGLLHWKSWPLQKMLLVT